MNAPGLREALRADGIPADVEARSDAGPMAVVSVYGDAAALEDDAVRQRIVSLARQHGFTHVALELLDAKDRAALSGD